LSTGGAGSPLRVIITGQQGADNGFSITDVGGTTLVGTGLATTVDAPSAHNRAALDAALVVNGLPVSRPSNRVSDVIEGVTLELLKTTGGAALPADRIVNISVTRDTAPVKEKIKQVVTNYNDLQAILDAALDKDSTVENLGATLVGDSTIKAIRAQVQRILMPDTGATADPGAPLTDLRQLGLFLDSDRRLKFASINNAGDSFASTFQVGSEQTLDRALATRFEDLAGMFTGSTGLATVMSDRLSGSGAYLDSSVRPSSPMRILKVQAGNFTERITQDQDRLAELRDRMDQLLVRYTKQFSIMESIVGESKSLRSSVENSFKAMSGGSR
jgi:flagellar hook-associated protein 2